MNSRPRTVVLINLHKFATKSMQEMQPQQHINHVGWCCSTQSIRASNFDNSFCVSFRENLLFQCNLINVIIVIVSQAPSRTATSDNKVVAVVAQPSRRRPKTEVIYTLKMMMMMWIELKMMMTTSAQPFGLVADFAT